MAENLNLRELVKNFTNFLRLIFSDGTFLRLFEEMI